MTMLLFIILVILVLGAIPVWPYSRNWGYWPGSILGLILLILIILMLTGRMSL